MKIFKKNRSIVSLAAVLLIFCVVVFCKNYFSVLEIPFKINKDGKPEISISINGLQEEAVISLREAMTLNLKKELIEKLHLERKGDHDVCDIDGHHHHVGQYIIKRMETGPIQAKNITTYEQRPCFENVVGHIWGDRFYTLFDFIDHKIQLCRSGFKINADWIVLPYKLAKDGLLIEIDTVWGKKTMLLASHSSISLINKTIIPEDDLDCYEQNGLTVCYCPQIELMGHSLGAQRFAVMHFPQEAADIDGILGMDFLQDKRLMIDLSKKTISLEVIKNTPIELPMTSIKGQIPYIEVKKESLSFLLALDTGSSSNFLMEESLSSLASNKHTSKNWKNFLGEVLCSDGYYTTDLNMGSFLWKKPLFYSMTQAMQNSMCIEGACCRLDGTLGNPLIIEHNLFVDFHKQIAYLSKDPNSLIAKGLMSLDWIKAPLQWDSFPVITVMTDFGIKRFVIDTGATHNMICLNRSEIMPSKKYTHVFSDKFVINKHDFGLTDFIMIYVSPDLGIDGAIGMNFLENHAIYFDYGHMMVWINPKKEQA